MYHDHNSFQGTFEENETEEAKVATFCSANGNGCHKMDNQEFLGVKIKNIQICCCDTDL